MIIAALLKAIGPFLRRLFGGGEDEGKGQDATGSAGEAGRTEAAAPRSGSRRRRERANRRRSTRRT